MRAVGVEARRRTMATGAVAGRQTAASVIALLLALSSAVAALLYQGRQLTYFYDEWEFIAARQGHGLDVFLRPHNQHLSIVPVTIYKALFKLVGLEPYWVYRLMIAVLVAVSALLVFFVVRRRAGMVVGVCSAVLIAFFTVGYEDMVWPFQIGFVGSVGCGLGVMLAFDGKPGRRADLVASGLIALAIGFSSVGLAVLIGATVELAVRRSLRRRWWVVAAPFALYFLWWLAYHEGSFVFENVYKTFGYTATGAATTLAGLFGLGTAWAYGIGAVVLLAVVVRIAKGPPVPPRFGGAAGMAFGLWAIFAIGRADQTGPTSSRYLFPAAVFLLVALTTLVEAERLPARAKVLIAVTTALVVPGAIATLRDAMPPLNDNAAYIQAELGALELARKAGPVDPAFVPDTVRTTGMTAGQYFSAIDSYGGSPADTPSEIARRDNGPRRSADLVFALARGLTVAPVERPGAAANPALTTGTPLNGKLTKPDAGGCVRFTPTAPGAALELPYTPTPATQGLAIRAATGAAVPVALRRFADPGDFPIQLNALDPGVWGAISIPADGAPNPWHVRLQPQAPLTACPLPKA